MFEGLLLGVVLERKLCLVIIFLKKMTMQNAGLAANYA